jgi:proteasome accessory factor B
MFERDKDELRSMGIPVETVLDVNGEVEGYLILRQTTPEDLHFSAAELALLGLAAASWQEAILEAPATTALRKIESISGDVPVVHDLAGIRVTATDAALLPLMAALREQHVVNFDYQGKSDQQAERRTVDPWGLVAHLGYWYFIGHDHTRGERRSFRVSRITGSVTVTARNLEVGRPANVNLSEIVRGEDVVHPITAKVWIQGGHGAALRQANAVNKSPFDDAEIVVSAVSIDVLVSQICAAGSGVKVIEPEEVQQLVLESLQTIIRAHQDAS